MPFFFCKPLDFRFGIVYNIENESETELSS